MLRATFKSLLARKARLLMSAMAIILGVGFVAGSLIFTDTLGRTFDGIMDGTVGDVVVQNAQAAESFGAPGVTVPAKDLDQYRDLDGVERVDGSVDAFGVFVVGKSGNVVGGQGAPALAFNETDAPNQLGEPPVRYTSGRAPTKEGEVAIDEQTLARAGYTVGDEIALVTAGDYPQIKARVVGTFIFGEGGMAGASVSIFDTTTAQKYFLKGKDAFNTVWVTTKDGVDKQQVADEVGALVPKGFEAKTGKAIADEAQTQIQEALGFITTFLLVFAGVALFVGSFLIVNTFSILVAQRSRELALLRAIGASRRQVSRSVLLEAFVVGVIGGTAGLAVGVLLAMGIKALFATIGLDLSTSELVFNPRTVIAAYLVGVIVTMVAAWLPARRAGSVSPVEAMRAGDASEPAAHPIRDVLKVLLLIAGVIAFVVGLFFVDTRQLWWIGAGIVGMLLGTAFLAPFAGRPVIRGLGWVYRRLYGTVGRMAEQNAIRNPGRTAATASALMIGMTLVALMGVVSASTKASVDRQIETSFRADYMLSNAVGQPFSSKIGQDAAKVEGVREVSPVRFTPTRVAGERVYLQAVDPKSFADVEKIEATSGTADLTKDTILLGSDTSDGKKVGDKVTIAAGGVERDFTIAGFYDEITALQNKSYLVSLDGMERLGAPSADNWVFIFIEPGADKAAVQDRLEALIKGQPLVTLKDQRGYADEQRASINQLLYLIYALLGLAIVIAVLGIINTLGLSVMERTREIGLLRAVGLARTQLRRMIRLEAICIALLGAVLGIGLGVISGVAIQRALVEDGITELVIPWASLVGFLVASAVVGVLAALWPAYRAGRLNILDAISSE